MGCGTFPHFPSKWTIHQARHDTAPLQSIYTQNKALKFRKTYNEYNGRILWKFAIDRKQVLLHVELRHVCEADAVGCLEACNEESVPCACRGDYFGANRKLAHSMVPFLLPAKDSIPNLQQKHLI